MLTYMFINIAKNQEESELTGVILNLLIPEIACFPLA